MREWKLVIYDSPRTVKEIFLFETKEQAEGGLMALNQTVNYPEFYGYSIEEYTFGREIKK